MLLDLDRSDDEFEQNTRKGKAKGMKGGGDDVDSKKEGKRIDQQENAGGGEKGLDDESEPELVEWTRLQQYLERGNLFIVLRVKKVAFFNYKALL